MRFNDRAAVILFAAARTLFCGYRAATQSLTADEAFSYNNFIGGPWSRIYPYFYDANNHVLYSILAKISVHAFHVSEFTIRLPSVIAGVLLVLGINKVLHAARVPGAIRWTSVLALSVHPLLLDFGVAARGYGLSLALLVWAIYFFMRDRDLTAGILLGLSISANLTIIYPAAGLAICPFWLRHSDSERRIQSCLTIAFSATLAALALCYPALSKASTEKFYAGMADFGGSVWNLISTSIHGSLTTPGLFGTDHAARVIQYSFLPFIATYIFARSLAGPRDPELAPLFMLLVAIFGLIAGHYVAHLNYPVDRLGLYLVLLFGLAWAVAASLAKRPLERWTNAALASLLIVQFATQIQARYLFLWKDDLAAKDVARRLQAETLDKAPGSVKISATWVQQPALEFYRDYYGIAALQPIRRYETTPLQGFDFYVVNRYEDKSVRPENLQRLRPIFSEPLSGILLAKEP